MPLTALPPSGDTSWMDWATAIHNSASGSQGILVASVDAPVQVKEAAHFVCDGTNDQTEINNAIDLAAPLQSRNAGMPAGAQQRGQVLLSGGEFTISGTGCKIRTAVTVLGTGFGTICKASGLGANPIWGLANNEDHLTRLGMMTILGNGTSGGTGNGVDYDMTGSTSTSGYPDINADSDHFIHDIYADHFTGGTRTMFKVWAAATANNRVNYLYNLTGRDASGNGVWLASASDSFISRCHMGGIITGDGFRIETGNTRIDNCKTAYCDGRGFYVSSGRGTMTGCESQDCNIGFHFDGAPFTAAGLTADTSQTDGIIVSTNDLQILPFSIFTRSGGRYATCTRGLNIDAAGYQDCSLVGQIVPTSITTPISGTLTSANRNFQRTSNGTTVVAVN